MGLGKGHTTRARRWRDISSLKLGEYVVGDLRMVWISASRVRVPKTKLPKDLATLVQHQCVLANSLETGFSTSDTLPMTFSQKGSSIWNKHRFIMVLHLLVMTLLRGILFSGYFGVIGRFFFTEFWILKIGLQRCKFCCRHHHFSDIVYPMNSGKVWWFFFLSRMTSQTKFQNKTK